MDESTAGMLRHPNRVAVHDCCGDGARPLEAPVSPAAVLSSVRAQRIELALSACCLAAVAWVALWLMDASPRPSPTVAQVRAAEADATLARPAAFAPPVVQQPVVPEPAPQPVPLTPIPAPAPPSGSFDAAEPPAPIAKPMRPKVQHRTEPPARPAPNPVRAMRHTELPSKPVARVVRRVSGPEPRCQHGLALTRDICVAMYCQSIEYRDTTTCVRLHTQRRQVTGLPAQSQGGS